jgi:adenosylcobinamide-GDP ribazoletransferase
VILDLRLAIGFLTRWPMRIPQTLPPNAMARAMWAFPLVGAFIGSLSGAAYLLAHRTLPEWPSALLALTVGVILTGALHEDGLADCADGFGGGWDKDKKLAIMRDSRIGTYGALALILSILLRGAAMTKFYHPADAIFIAHCLGRTALPVMMKLLPPASPTGVAASVGTPGWLSIAIALATGIGLTVWFYSGDAPRPLLAALLAVLAMALLAKRNIGGYTGDVLGATEQVVEISVLLSILPLP